MVSRDDLRRVYSDLSVKTRQALEQHLANLQLSLNIDPTHFVKLKADALREGGLTVTVQGANGEQVVAGSEDGLSSAYIPEKISWVSFDSAASLQIFNIKPLNRFTLRLDFTEPPGFHAYNPWNQPTPNNSELQVIGDDTTWVTGVYESTLAFFRRRGRRRGWLHTQHAFNVLNWLVGVPAGLWIALRIGNVAPGISDLHSALQGAIYIYGFLVAFLIFRVMIWGLRWMFPVIELEGARSNKTRGLLGAIIGSLLLTLAYDVLKTLFWRP